MAFLLFSKESSHAYDFCKLWFYRPRASRIIRTIPREAQLLRDVSQGLTVAEPCLILAFRECRGLAACELIAVAFDNPCAFFKAAVTLFTYA